MNCPDIRQVVHFGCTDDVKMYVQEIGRAGWDLQPSCALLFYKDKELGHASDEMKAYCMNNTVCRCEVQFVHFPKYSEKDNPKGCQCCDVCVVC